MSNRGSAQTTTDLRSDVGGRFSPSNAALQGVSDSDSGIEVRSRDTPECQNQSHKNRAGCYRVGKKSESDTAAGKSFGHDSRADYSGNEETRSYELCCGALSQGSSEHAPSDNRMWSPENQAQESV
jgi:uncharacterized membrane protein